MRSQHHEPSNNCSDGCASTRNMTNSFKTDGCGDAPFGTISAACRIPRAYKVTIWWILWHCICTFSRSHTCKCCVWGWCVPGCGLLMLRLNLCYSHYNIASPKHPIVGQFVAHPSVACPNISTPLIRLWISIHTYIMKLHHCLKTGTYPVCGSWYGPVSVQTCLYSLPAQL
jgi:hypothetical protein